MKKIILFFISYFFIISYSYAQISKSSHNTYNNKDAIADKSDLIKSLSTFSISGIGTTELADNPSANINALININPFKKKVWSFLLNFNGGSSQDTTNLKSLNLSKIFYPDNSSVGFTGGIEADLLVLLNIFNENEFKKCKNKSQDNYKKFVSLDNPRLGKNKNDFQYYSLSPQLQYLYRKININDFYDSTKLPRIETQSMYLGINAASHWKIGENYFDISINPFIKCQWITKATDSTYQHIFKSRNNNNYVSKKINSIGVNVSAQIGKVILSFIYDYINPKTIQDPFLTGGTFSIRIVAAASFLNFNFDAED